MDTRVKMWVGAVLLALTLSFQSSQVLSMNMEGKLANDLLKGYSKYQRPVENSTDPVRVELGIQLFQLKQVDMKQQFLELQLWLTMIWTDKRLSWVRGNYGGVKTLNLPNDDIWKPDILLANHAGTNEDRQNEKLINDVSVEDNGRCRWAGQTSIQASCQIDVRLFPFDRQTCKLMYGSLTLENERLLVMEAARKISADKGAFVSSGDWKINHVKSRVINKTYDCCSVPFSQIEVSFQLERRPAFFLAYLIAPCILIAALSLLVFIIPPIAGERIGFGITILLNMSVYLLVMSSFMPETSDNTPILGVFFVALMVEISLAFACSCITVWVYFKEGPITGLLAKIACVGHQGSNVIENKAVEAGTDEVTPKMAKTKTVKNEDTVREIRQRLTRKIDMIFFWFFAIIMVTTAVAIIWIKPDVSV